ncbi:hypothetical protein BDE36_3555 [Arcticibacter tournemirensis]|uniref:Addiction module toxin RelE n=1 Tax=Arcticibacter tournemirensis TaxID=699437 RepID=A0A5M9HCH5_9SPHI|nr:hypothetical protein [Arcticibacter tournemirensis]KAA8484035.1 hypothetical protein F1649_06725 [Arcticibacter tournemirensis]TQM51770.1 hypothetical protein BDE36_3555 [Arcticibacter tournemirensis]
MVRKAIVITRSEDGKRCIAVDESNYEMILAFLGADKRHKSKFRDIANVILNGLRNTELYDKEEPDAKSKGVRAMKFFKGQENARIYCREVTREDKTFVIIASELLESKKTQKINQRILNIIHRVASYDYKEIVEPS